MSERCSACDNSPFLKLAAQTIHEARAEHPNIHSAHEALGLILEEYREFEGHVFAAKALDRPELLRHLLDLARISAIAAEDLGCIEWVRSTYYSAAARDRAEPRHIRLQYQDRL